MCTHAFDVVVCGDQKRVLDCPGQEQVLWAVLSGPVWIQGIKLSRPLETQCMLLTIEHLGWFFIFKLCAFVGSGGVEYMCTSDQACRIQKRMLDPLEMWVTGTELLWKVVWSFGK